jgi:AraC-like DNA-binding protein
MLTSWLAALQDPLVAARWRCSTSGMPMTGRWTLASEVGASRWMLAERFAHFVGQPPMQYLTHWRMQMAARRLENRTTKVASVALEVGYESEAAFGRAFKRIAGVSPRRVARAAVMSPH